MTSLGGRIRSFRKEKKWTQELLAQKVGVSKQVVSNWERNISKPDHANILSLSRSLEVSVDSLLGIESGLVEIQHKGKFRDQYISKDHSDYYESIREVKPFKQINFRNDITITGTDDLIEIIFSNANLKMYGMLLSKDDKLMLADLLHLLFAWKSDIQEIKD